MYCVYLLEDAKGRTYVGATVNLTRRLRQHNQDVSGGARQTKRGGPWHVAACISGFEHWTHALKFEYAWRRIGKGGRGKAARYASLQTLLLRDRWSSKSPSACEIDLTVELFDEENMSVNFVEIETVYTK
jgi:predicted GIY-YIG superfamily endonuclease